MEPDPRPYQECVLPGHLQTVLWLPRPEPFPPCRSAAGLRWILDLAAFPVCVLGRLFPVEKWRIRVSHPTVKAYEAPMGTGPPAMAEIESECVGTELNRQSPEAGGLRPLELANAQPTQMNQVTRVGFEPTASMVLSQGGLPVAYRAN